MDIPTIPGAVYTISTTTSCDVTDKASGQPLGTATLGNPFSTPAYSDALTLSDPTALYVQIKTFNYALAALGLLGGGVTELPTGYIRAEFLESTGTQIIRLEVTPSDDLGGSLVYEDFQANTDAPMLSATRSNNQTPRFYFPYSSKGICYIGWDSWDIIGQVSNKNLRTTATLNFFNDRKYTMTFGQNVFEGLLNKSLPILTGQHLVLFSYNNENVYRYVKGRVYSLVLTQDKTVLYNLLPVISNQGLPCLFDKVSKTPFANDGSGAFIVGFTLPQARQLSKLPAGGGELTISLPSNWQEDAAVVDALSTAEGKGWVLTIQTYEAEAGAASTFALRRIWVRKRAEQNGSYVANDGTRWQVEWCETMVGGDPQDHGYEPFRSIEAAAEYWELHPEDEQLLTN